MKRPRAIDVANAYAAKRRRRLGPSRVGGVYVTRPSLPRRMTNASIARQVGGQETKYFDSAFSADASTTTQIQSVNALAQGNTRVTRIGNKIAMKSVSLRVSYNAEALAQNVKARFMLVIDHQSNASDFVVADLLNNPYIEAFTQIGNFGRFTVLMDKVVVLNSTTSTAGALQKGFFKKHIRIRPIHQIVNYNVGTASAPLTGNLVLLYLSDIAAGTTDMDVAGNVRLKFIG